MPRPWATTEQAIWLESRIPEFLKAQADKNLPRYYAKLYEDWFTKWSERDRLFGTSVQFLTVEQTKKLGEAVEAQRKVFRTLLTYGIHFNANFTASKELYELAFCEPSSAPNSIYK
jgi:hypothetical protein